MKNFLAKHWKTILIAVLGIALGSAVIGFEHKMRSMRADNAELKHNIEALTDTVKTVRMQNGELLASITGYISEVSELETYSRDLKSLAEEYKKIAKSNVQTLVSAETETVLPEKEIIFYRDTIKSETSIREDFDFSDEWRTLTGTLTVDQESAGIRLDPETVYAKFSAGLDENNRVFITTNNPYVKITGLEGFTVPKTRQKRWGLGVQVGYGYSVGANKFGPTVSVGINYNLLSF